MRVFVVRDEKDAADVRRRLVKPGAAAARGKAIEDAVRAANPHVDLDELRPGTVLVVPDHPDLADDAGEAGGAGAMSGGGLSPDQLAAALPRVTSAVRRSAEASHLRGEELRKALQAREVRKAADADDRLRAEVDRLSDVVADEQRRAQAWAEAVQAQTEHWQRALDDLNRLG